MRTYDLIFGILARQLQLVTRASLSEFSEAVEGGADVSLPGFLREADRLSESDEKLLQRLVDSIIHAHRGDELAALESVGGSEAIEHTFSMVAPPSQPRKILSTDKTVAGSVPPPGVAPEIQPEIIGRYTGGSEYARGGIGRILLVHDEQIGRDVILKELLPEHTVSPTASTLPPVPEGDSPSPSTPMRQSAAMMARFLQEAKVTGQLEHPSIVPVYELGTRADGQLYYTMKLIRGETLAATIEACKNADERLALLRPFLDVCQAMAYAHSKGVIHRDLKPSNIMVGEFGECVVLDWGLAKTAGDRDAHRDALEKTLRHLDLEPDAVADEATRDKDVLGTPVYMSPEQARSDLDAVGAHSDVYSLGVILYELLVGKLPHPWTNSRDTILRVGNNPATPVSDAAPHTPPELAAICDKALAFAPEDRYPSARELTRDVRHFLEGAVVEAYAYRLSDKLLRLYREHRTLINSVAVATLAILGIGLLSYVNIYRARQAEADARIVAEQEREEAQAQRAEAESQRITAEKQRARAETAEERTAREKYISDIRLADAYIHDYKFQIAEETLLATVPAYRNFEWAYLVAQCHQDLASLRCHNGATFTFLSNNGDYILTVSGDRSARLWDAESNRVLRTWAFPNHRILQAQFSPEDDRIAIWMVDGTITMLDPLADAIGLSWKAHETQVNDCVFDASGDVLFSCSSDRTVRAWDMASETPLFVIDGFPDSVTQIRFLEDKSRLLTECRNGLIQLFNPESGTLIASSDTNGKIADVVAGQIALLDGKDVVLLDDTSLVEKKRFRHEAVVSRARLYPIDDGLLTASRDGILRSWNVDTGNLSHLYNFRKPIHNCLLSHGYDSIIALASDGEIRVWDRETGDEVMHLGGHGGSVTTLDVSPDDTYILTASRDGVAKKWPLRESWASETLFQADAPLASATLAANGTALAYVSNEGLVRVIDLEKKATIYEANIPPTSLGQRLCLNADASMLGILLDDFLPVVIALADGRIVSELRGHDGPVLGIQFSPDSTEVITASWDQSIRI
ncbi:MAG: protein kinase, partial [Candidatus Hydrogenedentes bacterium]|nr:protein kinase [Candidatus Hydrogenedentota bacterium]